MNDSPMHLNDMERQRLLAEAQRLRSREIARLCRRLVGLPRRLIRSARGGIAAQAPSGSPARPGTA